MLRKDTIKYKFTIPYENMVNKYLKYSRITYHTYTQSSSKIMISNNNKILIACHKVNCRLLIIASAQFYKSHCAHMLDLLLLTLSLSLHDVLFAFAPHERARPETMAKNDVWPKQKQTKERNRIDLSSHRIAPHRQIKVKYKYIYI